jgi:hypothetical protein
MAMAMERTRLWLDPGNRRNQLSPPRRLTSPR